jgi:Protein of unknown function (DUF1572)
MDEVGKAFLWEAGAELGKALHKITHCLNQLNDEQVWHRPAAEMNSVANLLIHLGGNLRQWIISGVGGEQDVRRRQAEFDDRSMRSKKDLLAEFTQVLQRCDAVLAKTDPKNLLQRRRIQGFEVQLLEAIFNTVCHLKGHVQEIIHMTRQMVGPAYRFDFVPKGKEQGGA